MSEIDHHFGKLHRFGNTRPRWWQIRIDDRVHLYTSAQLARGALDIDLPYWFLREGWPKLLKTLLRENRFDRQRARREEVFRIPRRK